jgi:hypothetical protein
VDALETLSNFDTDVTFPVTFTKENHEGTTQTIIIRVGDDLHWAPHPEYKKK